MSLLSKKHPKKQAPGRRNRPLETRSSDSDLADRYAFRRNRTLTGSTSSNIVSPGEKNSQLQSPRVHAHHLVGVRRRLGAILTVVFASSLMLFVLISQFTSDVTIHIKDVPTATIQPSYSNIITEYYNQRPVERLRFMLDRSNLTRFVQTKAPEIADVDVVGSAGFAKSEIVLTPRKPVAGWDMSGVRQYVDASGTAFALNYYEAPGVQIVDNSGVPAEAGRAVASNRFLGFVGRLVGLTAERGYDVEQVIIPADTTRQVELKIKGIAFNVKCSIDRPAGEQAEDLDKAIKYLAQSGRSPGYIDVRVSGKAFYR